MTGAPHHVLAATFVQRLRGLLGRKASDFAAGQDLVIVSCSCIHTFGMREAIDVAFVDKAGVVVRVVRGLGPHRLAFCPKARMVVERFASSPERPWYERGDKLDMALL